MIDFRIVSWNKGKGFAANFPKMRNRRLMVVPEFVWSLTIVGGGASEICEIGGGCAKFIPEVGRSVTR